MIHRADAELLFKRLFPRAAGPLGRAGARLATLVGTSLATGLATGLAALALFASPVLAQDELRPPKTDQPPSGPKVIIALVAVLLVAGVVFAATLKSKRSHQD